MAVERLTIKAKPSKNVLNDLSPAKVIEAFLTAAKEKGGITSLTMADIEAKAETIKDKKEKRL